LAGETRWQALYRSALAALILGGILLGVVFYGYMSRTERSRLEDECLARGAQVIHLDDGSTACGFGVGEPVPIDR
jgi:hypothetical protein